MEIFRLDAAHPGHMVHFHHSILIGIAAAAAYLAAIIRYGSKRKKVTGGKKSDIISL